MSLSIGYALIFLAAMITLANLSGLPPDITVPIEQRSDLSWGGGGGATWALVILCIVGILLVINVMMAPSKRNPPRKRELEEHREWFVRSVDFFSIITIVACLIVLLAVFLG